MIDCCTTTLGEFSTLGESLTLGEFSLTGYHPAAIDQYKVPLVARNMIMAHVTFSEGLIKLTIGLEIAKPSKGYATLQGLGTSLRTLRCIR